MVTRVRTRGRFSALIDELNLAKAVSPDTAEDDDRIAAVAVGEGDLWA